MATEYQFMAVELADRKRWVSTTEARHKLPTHPSPSTFYRYRTSGCVTADGRTVLMPTFPFSGRHYTTLDAFLWFQRQQIGIPLKEQP